MFSIEKDRPEGLKTNRACDPMMPGAAGGANNACETAARRETVGERLDAQIKLHEGKATYARNLKGSLPSEVLSSDADDFRRAIGGGY